MQKLTKETTACLVLTLLMIDACKTRRHPRQPLQIKVFYETLDQDSLSFLRNSFYVGIQHKGIGQMADIQLIPFGRSYLSELSTGLSVTCPHGHEECQGNKWNRCLLQNLERALAWKAVACIAHISTKCTFTGGEQNFFSNNAQICMSRLDVPDKLRDKIEVCADKVEDPKVIANAEKETKIARVMQLPWIVVNGKHSYFHSNSIIKNLWRFVCRHTSNVAARKEYCYNRKPIKHKMPQQHKTFFPKIHQEVFRGPSTGTSEVEPKVVSIFGQKAQPMHAIRLNDRPPVCDKNCLYRHH